MGFVAVALMCMSGFNQTSSTTEMVKFTIFLLINII